VAAIEQALGPFAPRPHWGKVFGLHPEVVAATYPGFADFGELVSRADPRGKLRNAFLDHILLLSR
jgi:xylitol oxidase